MQTILVIDPDQHFRDYVKLVLERAGYAAHALSSGAGLDRLLRDLAVDAVICDVYLPDANGIEALRALRAAAPGLPLIVISASGPASDDPRWRALSRFGVVAVIGKPAHPPDILAALRRALPPVQDPTDSSAVR